MEQFPRLREVKRPPEEPRNVDLDTALNNAISEGRMTIKQAEECREAYYDQLRSLPNPPEHPGSTPAA